MKRAKHVYAIEVRAFDIPYDSRISQVAFGTYDAAANFIMSRSDKPQWITKYCLKSDEYDYVIHDLIVES